MPWEADRAYLNDMAASIPFNPAAPRSGIVERVSPLIRRLVAPNPGPFTFSGTCTYIVGTGRVAIVDPGPDGPEHVARLIAAVEGERVEAILVTHTHADHSPAARALAATTGARMLGAGPHRSARPLADGEVNLVDASADHAFVPDAILADGDRVTGPGWTLQALATPGHCANHLAFSLVEDRVLLSGDHVMGWSTSIVAPPDGAMGDYMASLNKLLGREDVRYLPGHGGPVEEPRSFVRALIQHRRMREASILKSMAQGPRSIPDIVATVYRGLDPALIPAASLNTLAHLEDLVTRASVLCEGTPGLASHYSLA